MRRGLVPGRGRVPVRLELPLLALPCSDGLGLQPLCRIEHEKLELTDGGNVLLIVGDEDLNDKLRDVRLPSFLRGAGRPVRARRPEVARRPKAPWFEITDNLPQFEEHAN